MKFFWPHRSDPKGFSIENLAHKYREKIFNEEFNKNQKQILDDSNLGSRMDDSKGLGLRHIYTTREHWANRDFSEYREAA